MSIFVLIWSVRTCVALIIAHFIDGKMETKQTTINLLKEISEQQKGIKKELRKQLLFNDTRKANVVRH